MSPEQIYMVFSESRLVLKEQGKRHLKALATHHHCRPVHAQRQAAHATRSMMQV